MVNGLPEITRRGDVIIMQNLPYWTQEFDHLVLEKDNVKILYIHSL